MYSIILKAKELGEKNKRTGKKPSQTALGTVLLKPFCTLDATANSHAVPKPPALHTAPADRICCHCCCLRVFTSPSLMYKLLVPSTLGISHTRGTFELPS